MWANLKKSNKKIVSILIQINGCVMIAQLSHVSIPFERSANFTERWIINHLSLFFVLLFWWSTDARNIIKAFYLVLNFFFSFIKGQKLVIRLEIFISESVHLKQEKQQISADCWQNGLLGSRGTAVPHIINLHFIITASSYKVYLTNITLKSARPLVRLISSQPSSQNK